MVKKFGVNILWSLFKNGWSVSADAGKIALVSVCLSKLI